MREDRNGDAAGLITPREFAQVAELLKRIAGISLNPGKRAMVSGRLNKRLKVLGYRSIGSYCAALAKLDNADEQDEFISALTTNMTRFNRESHHFTHLTEKVLPELLRTARGGGRARIWSAGCSTGEEAYDLAFRVLQACPDATKLDIRILATDIDKSALAAAQAGLYPAATVAQLPDEQGKRFFDHENAPAGLARVCQAARDLIAFRPLNLDADWPFHGNFDAIMCRNVAIYFDEQTQTRLWRRFADRLQVDGVLYIGHSEALPKELVTRFDQGAAGAFRLVDGLSGPARRSGITTEKTDESEGQNSHSCG